jgi:signal transduction histidine kinase
VAIDLLLANLLFFFNSSTLDPFIWAGFLPVGTAGILFGIRGAFLVVLLSAISLGLQTVFLTPSSIPLILVIWMILGLAAASLAILYLRQVVVRQYETIQREQLRIRQEVEKAAEERLSTLVNASKALNQDLDGERIVNSVLRLSANLLSLSPDPASQPVGAVLLREKCDTGAICLQVVSALRFAQAEEPVRFPMTGGLLTRSLIEGQPRLSKEASKDPEIYRFPALRTCQAVYCIPLSCGTAPEPFGVLLLAHSDENIFTQERRDLLDEIGRMAGRAVRNALRYRDLDRERARLIGLLQENRNRLVRELHDGSTQSVSALALRANLIRRTFERDSKISIEELHKLEDLARTTAREIRQMLFTLRPLEQKEVPLDVSLENLADNLRKSDGKNVIVSADPEVSSCLEPMKQAVIFYVAEEAIENAHRNGNIEPIQVRVRAEEGLATLEVEHSGSLGDVADVAASYESRNSMSVSSMRERAALVNGYLEIEPAGDLEVKIRLLVPTTPEAAERLRDRC